ncbi:cytochrome-c peroxidase [Archangium primigenium]|uniref:cytochrome-c peroxidase n=1 Tax=[Archangium] primigenium TaxID=2792470 RepID=UPI001957C5E6|nr:cytochrome c peroxidase [Archangium primigenium]MBM7119045.1 methylamine utilization protein [Archangium primigenium]
MLQQLRRASVLGGALLVACGPGPASDPGPGQAPTGPVLPLGHTALPSPEDNPLTPEGVALGRWLFYAPQLSSNGQVSCATCHVQARAFALDVPLATLGVSGRPLARHTPTLINLAWAGGLFWDGGAKNLESLSLAPLTHADEMGQADLQALMDRLAATPEAVRRFEAAFGPGGPSLSHLLRALAQFQRTLVSADSRYDRWRRGEPGAGLSTLERAGHDLVRERCAPCHGSELFTDQAFHNNGLDAVFGTGEQVTRGRGRVTLRAEDTGRYKTPTLRNVARSAPYMHDGRFPTLDAVLEHYRHGMVDSPTLDGAFRRAPAPPGVPLTDLEKTALLAFLDTLTDEAFLTSPDLGPPPGP